MVDINSLSSAGVRFFLVRKKYQDDIASQSTVIYPDSLKKVISFKVEREENYSIEVCKVLRRRQIITEPPYILIAYASRVDL